MQARSQRGRHLSREGTHFEYMTKDFAGGQRGTDTLGGKIE